MFQVAGQPEPINEDSRVMEIFISGDACISIYTHLCPSDNTRPMALNILWQVRYPPCAAEYRLLVFIKKLISWRLESNRCHDHFLLQHVLRGLELSSRHVKGLIKHILLVCICRCGSEGAVSANATGRCCV